MIKKTLCFNNPAYLSLRDAQLVIKLPEVEKADILSDDFSKNVLENEINFKLTGNIKFLTEIFTDKNEIFRILDLSGNESYLDLGAYRGDTIQEFLHYTNGSYRHITALEPDKKTFKKLKEKNLKIKK